VIVLAYMLAAAMCLGALGLFAFIWSLRSGQFDDPAGAAARILEDHDPAP